MTSVGIIDLGSSSFHLLITQLDSKPPHKPLFRHKVKVELRAGMAEDGTLSLAAEERALACLAEFAHWLQHHQVQQVRAVGTFTLRSLNNSEAFLARAEQTLGFPIQIITGEEEARLIYVGAVSQTKPHGAVGVIDIGGGSTELMMGQGQTLLAAFSLPMGCVSFQQQFFKEGELSQAAFSAAIAAAHQLLQPVLAECQRYPWHNTIGCSGTLQAVSYALKAGQRSSGIIQKSGLDWLHQQLLQAGHISQVTLAGPRHDRLHLLPGGLAVLMALFEHLPVQTLRLSRGGIREGLLHEHASRIYTSNTSNAEAQSADLFCALRKIPLARCSHQQQRG